MGFQGFTKNADIAQAKFETDITDMDGHWSLQSMNTTCCIIIMQ